MVNPDLILHNARIYYRPGRRTQALAIWNGRVTDVGSDDEILKLRARSVEVVNLRNRTVIPGLSDSHVHLLWYGILLHTLDLTEARSISEVQNAVAHVARTRPRNNWIIGRGWDQEKFEEHRFLDRGDFSGFKRHSIFLKRICGHLAVANDRALKLAGISSGTADPRGGEIVRNPSTGEPTGLLKETAIDLVEQAVPRKESEVRSALVEAASRLARLGLTSLHCIIEDELELRVLKQLKNEGRIVQSIYAILPVSMLDRAVAMGLVGDKGGDGFVVGGFKVYLDGSLGARTAALFEPYSDDPKSLGILRMDAKGLDGVVQKASGLGFQLCIHAIGDRAVESAVGALEKVVSGKGRESSRHRIEHASLTPFRLIGRMKRAGIIASVQPRFIYSDSWAGFRLGSRRVSHLYPFRSMLHAGVGLAFGSDCPVEDPNPFEGIWSAVVRPGLPKSQALSVSDAFSAYTTGSAFASFSERDRGTLEPGKKADMLVLDRDPFDCTLDTLRRTNVDRVIINGKKLRNTNNLFVD